MHAFSAQYNHSPNVQIANALWTALLLHFSVQVLQIG